MELIDRKIIVQRLKRNESSALDVAIRYYTILSAINGLKLTERELQLIAFLAIKGNISYSTNKKEFCSLYKSSAQTISNIIGKLKKLGILVKEGFKIKVNPAILLNFEKDIVLQTTLTING